MAENTPLQPGVYARIVLMKNHNKFMTANQIVEQGDKYGLKLKTIKGAAAHERILTALRNGSKNVSTDSFLKSEKNSGQYKLTRVGLLKASKYSKGRVDPPVGITVCELAVKILHSCENNWMTADEIVQKGGELGVMHHTNVQVTKGQQIYNAINTHKEWFQRRSETGKQGFRLTSLGLEQIQTYEKENEVVPNPEMEQENSKKRTIDQVTEESTSNKKRISLPEFTIIYPVYDNEE
jgi:predicted transcriptional regulator